MLHLELHDVSKNFGGNLAVDNVTLTVDGPQLIGMIGPNGAGKTTLANLMSGMLNPSRGTISLNGRSINGRPAYEVARAGLGRTFQVTRALRRMTVLENMLVPAWARYPNDSKAQIEERAREVLDFLTMSHLAQEYGRALSGGQQKLLELARLLMLDPNIIILDEPFAGVHPRLQQTIYAYIDRVYKDGKAVLLISHDMDAVFELSQRLLVLNFGALIADGEPEAVRSDPAVIEAYLGEDDEEDAAQASGADNANGSGGAVR
ncbi:MAG: ABC transporter ATP-binding protein [Anaerolineaceae bacterium]|nr:ABC transporter ATP-binding protein [Anaerolineaceae bacterium]MCY4009930.1 ABC transporter ATP-binding protein [Anaerolineaceae bacterium]